MTSQLGGLIEPVWVKWLLDEPQEEPSLANWLLQNETQSSARARKLVVITPSKESQSSSSSPANVSDISYATSASSCSGTKTPTGFYPYQANCQIEKSAKKCSVICNSVLQRNLCKYGEKCQFAHQVEYLRPTRVSRVYKTSDCNSIDCPDSRTESYNCHFSHVGDKVWSIDQTILGANLRQKYNIPPNFSLRALYRTDVSGRLTIVKIVYS